MRRSHRSRIHLQALLSIPIIVLFLSGLAGCGAPSVLTDKDHEDGAGGGISGYVFDVDGPFEIKDPSGRPYHHPFLGGFNIPRPQLIDIDGDGDQDLFVQEEPDAVMYFENMGTPGSAPSGSNGARAGDPFVYRSSKFAGIDVGEWFRYVDLDEDGLPDLLTEQPFSYVRYLQNRGQPGQPSFEVAADSLKDVAGEPIFSDRQNIPNVADIDCDGNPDLFIGRLEGTITRYEWAEVREGVPRFAFVGDRFQGIEIIGQILGSMRGGAGWPLAMQGAGNARKTNGTDNAGTMRVADNAVATHGGANSFTTHGAANSFATHGGVNSATTHGQGNAGTMHGANTLAFVDIDADGDQDILWGDYFEPGLLLIENTGSCRRISFGQEPRPFPLNNPVKTSGYNAPAPGDVDGDGDTDLLVGVLGGAFNANTTTADNLFYLEQTEPDVFALRSERFINTVDVGAESIAAIGDIDSDGDPDLLLSNQIEPQITETAGMYLFRMEGGGRDRRWQLTDTLRFKPAYHYAPALGDLDGDGDLDMVLGTWRNELQWYRNESSNGLLRLEPVDGVVARLSRGSNATPALVDIDADGDLDLFVGETTGTINFFRNVGTSNAPQFEEVTDNFSDIDVGRRSFPTFEDVDADGDFDLVIGRDEKSLAVYMNSGTPQSPLFESVGTDDTSVVFAMLTNLAVPKLATPVFVDLDGDGDRDLVSGSQGGGVVFFERR
ncbi:MAG: VCBS repeat-containing protein [Rhodothermia bacterium]|nr:VCBS repeat-containing protein [Rhodothermia bacterium]